MLGHDTLMNYFKTNFALMQHHKYSLTELENMIPWERFIYVDLLKEYIKEQDQKMRDQAATIKKRR
jgi:3-methyladenine DNA glycosylase AlkD